MFGRHGAAADPINPTSVKPRLLRQRTMLRRAVLGAPVLGSLVLWSEALATGGLRVEFAEATRATAPDVAPRAKTELFVRHSRSSAAQSPQRGDSAASTIGPVRLRIREVTPSGAAAGDTITLLLDISRRRGVTLRDTSSIRAFIGGLPARVIARDYLPPDDEAGSRFFLQALMPSVVYYTDKVLIAAAYKTLSW
jgi:hypothetical protein